MPLPSCEPAVPVAYNQGWCADGCDGGCGGGECHADFAHDTIVAKLNRRAGARTLFIQ